MTTTKSTSSSSVDTSATASPKLTSELSAFLRSYQESEGPVIGSQDQERFAKASLSEEQRKMFPILAQLLEFETLPAAAKKEVGLFESMLNKEPEHILLDARDWPEHYNAQALALIEALYEGAKKWDELSAEEQKKVDEAALSFFSAKQKIQEKKLPSTEPVKVERYGEPSRAEPVEGPVLDAFWWAG